MINKKGLLPFQNILLNFICSPSYALEDTAFTRDNQYNSIPQMVDVIKNLQSGSSDQNTNAINTILGGSGTTQARSANILNSILTIPTNITSDVTTLDQQILTSLTGNLQTDLTTARGKLMSSPGATLEADIGTVNSLLNGTALGSITQMRIGTPMVNGIPSSLAAVIGGPGSGLATNLGDPLIGAGSSLSGLINASAANNSNNVYLSSALANLNNATSLYDQVQCFLALFNPSNFTNSANTSITFTIGGSISSLADIINSATSTS